MTDRGVVGIMDSRLTSKGYGGKFLASLPPAQRVYTVDEVAKFFNK
jgi:Rad3-related DNA helicase